MIKFGLARLKDKLSVLIEDGYRKDEPILVTERYGALNGAFKAVQTSGAATETITAPDGDGAVVLTDLILGTDKVNGATVTLQWTDDIETIVIYAGTATDAPINIGVAFSGHWQGWRGARLELVTTGINFAVSVAVGYFKVSKEIADTFSVWDSKR